MSDELAALPIIAVDGEKREKRDEQMKEASVI
jgi:hypothetical protein